MAVLVLSHAPAGAIEFAVLGGDEIAVQPGEPFTIDLAVENAAQTLNWGVRLRLEGLAAAGAVVTGGRSAATFFNRFCTSETCYGGVITIDNSVFDSGDLSASGHYTPGDDAVAVMSTSQFQSKATNATGALDPGLDGRPGMPSPRDVTIELVASALGVHVLSFVGQFALGGVECPCTRPLESTPFVTIHVVPEPSSALMVSIGLAALALRRRPPASSTAALARGWHRHPPARYCAPARPGASASGRAASASPSSSG